MQDTLVTSLKDTLPVATTEIQDLSVPFEKAHASDKVPEYSIDYNPFLPDTNNKDSFDLFAVQGTGYINLYNGHELKAVHGSPLQKENVYQDWFFPIFILVLGAYTWLRIFYNKYFNQLIQAFVNTNLTNQIVRDENILVQRASILLALTFNVIAALFLYLLSLEIGWELGTIGYGFKRFLFFITIVSAAYTVKFLILKIIGWLFDLDKEMATYIFNIFLINNILGLVLVPIVALMAYNPIIETHFLAELSLWLIGCAFIYRLFRGMLTGISVSGFSPLYLFLYLCTLEIAPLLVLIRIVNP
ncbi:MAG: DUF4271 domain-containing protein [Bacteroidia bacterium]|nr:DUF4271 domain-containing protein [Bacteroidia bacterium]